MATWGFLTNHAVVLLHLAGHSNSTLREISKSVGLTERSVITIIRALEEEGIASHTREGRRNIYQIHYTGTRRDRRPRSGFLPSVTRRKSRPVRNRNSTR